MLEHVQMNKQEAVEELRNADSRTERMSSALPLSSAMRKALQQKC